MDFLYNMYNHPNFGLYLFTAITILAVLFVIVLLLALKDAKKVEKLENEKEKKEIDLTKNETSAPKKDLPEETEEDTFSFQEDTPGVKLEDKLDDLFVSSTPEEDHFTSANLFAEPEDIAKDYHLSDDQDDFTFDSTPEDDDEDEFKTSIIEGINTESFASQAMNDKPLLDPIKTPEISDIFAETNSLEPVSKFKAVREEFKPIYDEGESIPKKETKVNSYPSQFSSVYVDKKPEDILPKKAEEPVHIPQPKEESVPTPEELPKPRHIPTPKPIQVGINKNNLDSVEKETYNIK